MPQPHHQAVVARRFGAPLEVLRLEDVPTPELGQGEARVRMIASPINPSGLIPVTGAYASRTDLPFVSGFEGVGVVEKVHEAADQALLGRRVLPVGFAGGWQQQKVTPLEWLIPVPDGLSDEQAATAYINPLTAIRMVEAHANPATNRAVVDAAGSAIAPIIAHLLKARGIEVIGLVRTARRLDTSLFDQVLPTCHPDWERALGSVDVAFDCVGGDLGTRLGRLLSPGGALVHYGLLSGAPLDPTLWEERPDITVDLFRLRGWVHGVDKQSLHDAFATAFGLIREGAIRTNVQASFPLGEFTRAIELATAFGSNGKVLLQP